MTQTARVGRAAGAKQPMHDHTGVCCKGASTTREHNSPICDCSPLSPPTAGQRARPANPPLAAPLPLSCPHKWSARNRRTIDRPSLSAAHPLAQQWPLPPPPPAAFSCRLRRCALHDCCMPPRALQRTPIQVGQLLLLQNERMSLLEPHLLPPRTSTLAPFLLRLLPPWLQATPSARSVCPPS